MKACHFRFTHFSLTLRTFVLVHSSGRASKTALYLKKCQEKGLYHLLVISRLFVSHVRPVLLYAPLTAFCTYFSSLISAWRLHLLRTFSLLQAPKRIPRPRRIVRGLVRHHRVLSRIREVRTKTTTRCSKIEIQAVLSLS